MMLDEFPALGRLDFFETALAFMAGYGIRAYLIAQSLNQIAKAYGENNAILDNCHVRIAFCANDERTAKRISDALGTATELRAQRNYAGHRLVALARARHGQPAGNRAPAADAGRGDAAAAGRRDGPGCRACRRSAPRSSNTTRTKTSFAGCYRAPELGEAAIIPTVRPPRPRIGVASARSDLGPFDERDDGREKPMKAVVARNARTVTKREISRPTAELAPSRKTATIKSPATMPCHGCVRPRACARTP